MDLKSRASLNIQVNDRVDGTAVVSIKGGMVSETGHQLKDTLVQLVDEGVQHLVLNLRDVDAMDSMGLGVLVSAMNRLRPRHGSVSLVSPSAAVRSVLEITRLSQIVQIFPSSQEAVRRLGAG